MKMMNIIDDGDDDADRGFVVSARRRPQLI